MFSGKWYCLYTKPKSELFVKQNLEAEGFGSYLPMMLKKTRSGRRFHERKVPLFPSYVFASTENTEDMIKLRSIRGVNYVLRSKLNEPIEVPVEILNSLDSYCNDSVFMLEEAEFESGDEVILADKCFNGVEAVFQKYKSDRERVIILLDILNGQEVEVAADQVRKK